MGRVLIEIIIKIANPKYIIHRYQNRKVILCFLGPDKIILDVLFYC